MIIPNSFKNRIASAFYDKTISKYSSENVEDDEGWSRDNSTLTGTYKGNIQFSKLAEVQEEYGIREDIDAYITCPTTEAVSLGDIQGYNDILYRVVDVKDFDSHKLIFIKKWSSKCSISPSV